MKTEPDNADFYSGVRWSAASRYGMQFVRMANSIVLARLLAPNAFGIIAMVSVATGFAEVLTKMGFGVAIVQQKAIDAVLLNTIFWANIVVCGLLTLSLIASSQFVAIAFDEPQVAPVLMFMSVTIVIGAFSTVSQSLLTRRMAFRSLALRELASVAIYGVTATGLAFVGAGVWSLVVGAIAASLASTILVNLIEDYRPKLEFDWARLKSVLRFGINLTGVNLINYLSRNSDNAIIGYWLGSASLGVYSMAYKLMLLPREVITRVLIRVLLPKLSRLQDDDQELAEVFVKANSAIAILTWPMMCGLAILAKPFVLCLLGPQWLECVPIIQILAGVGALQSMGETRTQLLIAKGRTRLLLILTLSEGTLAVCSFIVGVHWGATGVAFCYLLINVIAIPISFIIVFSLLKGKSIVKLIRAILPCGLATGFMWAVLALADTFTAGKIEWPIVQLAIFIPIGAAAYTAVVYALRPAGLNSIIKLLRFRSQFISS